MLILANANQESEYRLQQDFLIRFKPRRFKLKLGTYFKNLLAMQVLFGGFKYLGLENLGDQIQSLAAERFLPKIHRRFNRDTISQISCTERYIIVMNGWFSHKPNSCFPPSDSIFPVFWGFHVTNWNDSWNHVLSPENIEYLKSNGPIGCRDWYTTDKLKQAGIDSFYSRCLSLTFPKRKGKPMNSWNIIVDVPIPLPTFIEDNALRITHSISPNISEVQKTKQAQKLLDLYRDHANIIITTRLHCALPCIGMGIPVIFLGNPADYRTSIIQDIGLEVYELPRDILSTERSNAIEKIRKIWSDINWKPEAIDFEPKKREIIDDFKLFLNNKILISRGIST